MVKDDAIVKVKNRFDGTTTYAIPEDRINRIFAAEEVKEIPMSELRKLTYQPGGEMILKEYLCIMDENAAAELIGGVEPEYNYSEEDVKNVMLNGTMDEFLDMLDFAPTAVKEMINSMAVKYELNDVAKREAILAKNGFNVTRAIENLRAEHAAEADAGLIQPQSQQTRRVTSQEKVESNTGRRTAPSVGKYKVVS
jgi:hypothetical protein